MNKTVKIHSNKRDLGRDAFGLLVMMGVLSAATAVRGAIFLPEYL